jgi:DNA repair exonuclease SbcCD ATPase subunit
MIENINPTDKIVVDVSMYQIDINASKLQSLRREVATKYNVPIKNVYINPKPISVDENGKPVSLTSDIITSIQDPKFQQNLFKEYIDIKKIENVDMDMILDIDNRVNAFVDFDSYSKYKSYKFKYVKWKNFLSYGDDNYIDFTKLHGLVLLCGNPQNQSGKTTLARNLLRFALFGRSEKTPNLASVFNEFLPEETEMRVEVGIEIEGEDYVIRRTVTRPAFSKRTAKSKCKQTVDYYKVIDNELELIENCEAESTQQTNNIIRDSIGSLEDFDLIVSATAKTLGDLFSMGQTDQGKLFSRWLGLLSLEKKENIAKDIYKKNVEPTLLSNKYNRVTLETEITDMKTVIKDNDATISKLEKDVEDKNKELKSLNDDKVKIMSERKEVKETLIKTDVTTVENNIAFISDKLTNERAKFAKQKEEWAQVKDVTFDVEEHKTKQHEKIELATQNGAIKQEILLIRQNIQHINELIEQKVCPNCGHEVDVNSQTEIIDKENNKIEQLIQNGVENKKKIDALDKEILVLEENREKVNSANKLKLSMTALHTQIENYKLQIESLNKTKQEIETNRDNILHNNEIDNKIRIVDENIRTITNAKETHIRTIQSCKDENTRYTKEINARNKLITKLVEEEKIIRSWNIYKELIGKNGILKIVLKRALPIINNEISTLLNGLVDFDVVLSVSDDNKVCIDLVHDGVSMSVGRAASGYEETMASLALRSALATVSSFAKPNLLVLDEIFGATGSSHYDDIRELLNRIMKNHDFVIDITHNEMITDWHNQIIEVIKENNISRIVVK